MIFDDDYEHKLCFGLADFLCVRENQSQIDSRSFVSENSKSKVERVQRERRENELKSSVLRNLNLVWWMDMIRKKKNGVVGRIRVLGLDPKK